MLAIVYLLTASLANLFKSRRRLEAENLFLRHQLNIALRRRPARFPLRGSDRALLVWMTRLWPRLLGVARVVEPATILRWHRAGFMIGTLRRDYLDHVLIFGARHLRRILTAYSHYYNETRAHLSLNKDAPSFEQSNGRGPLSLGRFCQACIIATRGYDFREGQVIRSSCCSALQRYWASPRSMPRRDGRPRETSVSSAGDSGA